MTVETNRHEIQWQSLETIVLDQTLSEQEVFSILFGVAVALQQLHKRGFLYLSLSIDSIQVDATLEQVSLLPRDEIISFGGMHIDVNLIPNWLLVDQSLKLSQNQSEVQAALTTAGISERSEGIDLYQFGTLSCQILTGESVSVYLRSPKTKAKVPPHFQLIIDRALGFNPKTRPFGPLTNCRKPSPHRPSSWIQCS